MRSPARTPGVPGTLLVVTLLAAGLAWTGWAAWRRVELPGAAVWPDMRLDVNTATSAELNALPGIGPTLAGRIVAERDTRGPYAALDDLRRVRGIGPALIEHIEPYAVVQK